MIFGAREHICKGDDGRRICQIEVKCAKMIFGARVHISTEDRYVHYTRSKQKIKPINRDPGVPNDFQPQFQLVWITVPDQVRTLSQVVTKKILKGGWAILELFEPYRNHDFVLRSGLARLGVLPRKNQFE